MLDKLKEIRVSTEFLTTLSIIVLLSGALVFVVFPMVSTISTNISIPNPNPTIELPNGNGIRYDPKLDKLVEEFLEELEESRDAS